MTGVVRSDLPATALLRTCRDAGAYTDGYVIEVDGTVSLPVYIEAFYTTPLFKVERAILKWFVARPSSDSDARRLADGGTEIFAAWRVEARHADQLLLVDFTGRTKSWLMTVPATDAGSGTRTRLYFGSAAMPSAIDANGKRKMGAVFQCLLGFHKLYSRCLLSAAASRIQKVAARA
jgi:hypothetical protein